MQSWLQTFPCWMLQSEEEENGEYSRSTYESPPQRSIPGVDEQGRHRMADDSGRASGHPECAWPNHPLWKHGQEEMGSELSLHGPLRLCHGPSVLGPMGT